MPKPETKYIAGVHRHLPSDVYAEKMSNPYRGGTPDMYYEGGKDTMFIEYKFAPRLAPVTDLLDRKRKPHVSALQESWLVRTNANSCRCGVILGTADGGLILPGLSWMHPIKRSQATLLPYKEVAAWIASQVR